MKEINEIKFKEETNSAEKENRSTNIEVAKTPELDELSEEISEVKNAIDRDSIVKLEQVLELEKDMDNLKVDLGGEKFTIKELKNIPELKMDIEIWKEIEGGNFERVNRVTHLNIAVAGLLANEKGSLFLSNLRSISDKVAELLSNHEGDLLFYRLPFISDNVAEALSNHTGILRLDGLTSVSDKAAEALSRHKGVLGLDGLTDISDKVAEILSKHKDESLWLSGLTSLSDQAAKYLSERKDFLGVKREIQDKINKFKK